MNMNEVLRRDLIGIINECRRVMEQAELELALLDGGTPSKKDGTYPELKEDIRIPIDSQTNYK